jgi:hypothetical protein
MKNKQILKIESNVGYGVVFERSTPPENHGNWLARFYSKFDEQELQEVLNELKTINAMKDNEAGLMAVKALIERNGV